MLGSGADITSLPKHCPHLTSHSCPIGSHTFDNRIPIAVPKSCRKPSRSVQCAMPQVIAVCPTFLPQPAQSRHLAVARASLISLTVTRPIPSPTVDANACRKLSPSHTHCDALGASPSMSISRPSVIGLGLADLAGDESRSQSSARQKSV